jgi:thioredoxin reductase (NADPH)
MEEADFLTKFASKVYLLVRRDELRASKIMAQRATNNPKIEFLYSTVCTEAMGSDGLEKIRVKDLKTNEEREIDCIGLFFAIGHIPNTSFLDGQLELDEQGYVVTTPGTTTTSVPGVFACGDVQDKKYRQAITAAGTGCMAAIDAEHFLASNG